MERQTATAGFVPRKTSFSDHNTHGNEMKNGRTRKF